MFNLTKESFLVWRMSETGREVFRALQERKDEMAKMLVDGCLLKDQIETARLVGVIQGIDALLQFEVVD